MKDIARWVMRAHRYDLRAPVLEKVLARDLAQAMREEYITDSKGRRVRGKGAAESPLDGIPQALQIL